MKKILIVDDEEILREMLRDFFEMSGFAVTEASSGKQAFELVQSTQFDCVVSDVRMPGGDGIELARNIHLLSQPKPKVILVTGYSDITEDESKEFGVLFIVYKPFMPKDLINIVKDAIALTV